MTEIPKNFIVQYGKIKRSISKFLYLFYGNNQVLFPYERSI